MGPRLTRYRLASTPMDYRRCHTLAHQSGHAAFRAGWPTVLAERDGHVVGFLATFPGKQAIVAGPLLTPGTVPGWIGLRLVEAYEVVLRVAGVSFYYFTVERDEAHAAWRRILDRLGLTPESADAERLLYLRRLS